MTQEEYEQIEGELTLHWKNSSTSPDFQVVLDEWEYQIQSSIRANAAAQNWSLSRYRDALIRGWRALGGLFDGLHPVGWPEADSKHAEFLWRHQHVDMQKAGDERRGFAIDLDKLTHAATNYLASPDSQTNHMDWLVLDVLVFAEIESGTASFKENMTALGARVAESIAGGNSFKYALWRAIFFVVSFFSPSWQCPWGLTTSHRTGMRNSHLGCSGSGFCN